VSVNNTTLFIHNKNSKLSGRHVSTFIGSSSGPLRKQIKELSMFQYIVGSQMLTNFCYRKVKYISLCMLKLLCDGLGFKGLNIMRLGSILKQTVQGYSK